jgi:hypothetical protein
MPDSPPAITEAHINRFRQRARFHFGLSYAILFGILILFGFAIYIFLFAQQIDRGKGSIQVLQELLVAKRERALLWIMHRGFSFVRDYLKPRHARGFLCTLCVSEGPNQAASAALVS